MTRPAYAPAGWHARVSRAALDFRDRRTFLGAKADLWRLVDSMKGAAE